MQEFDTASANTQENAAQADNSTTKEQVGIPIPGIKFPLLTYMLLGSIAVIFVIQMIEWQMFLIEPTLSGDPLPFLSAGAADFVSILLGDYDRLFTAIFFH